MKAAHLNMITTFIVVFLLAYILGLVVVQTVDNRLQEISINMPEIKLPTVKSVEPVPYQPSQYYSTLKPTKKYVQPLQEGGGKSEKSVFKCPVKGSKRSTYDDRKYKSASKSVAKPPSTRKTDQIPHKKSLPVAYPNSGVKPNLDDLKSKTPLVELYYKDPKEMTLEQQIKFRNRAKVHKMTVRDYENWLLMFKSDKQNLEQEHRENLSRLLRGDRLSSDDIPVKKYPVPPSAENRFNEKMGWDVTQVVNSETAGTVHAANYGDFDDFMPPKDLKHLTHFNPDTDKKFQTPFLKAMKPVITKNFKKTRNNKKMNKPLKYQPNVI